MFFHSMRHELAETARKPHLWALLAWYDIKQRYRRSVLGPFWFTISTAVLIGTLGLLWATLFKVNLKEYLPYFAAGNVLWTFIAMQLNEATTGFIQFESLIKQTRLPYPSYILRLLCRNFIIFLHNFIIVIVVVTFVGEGWGWVTLLAIPGLLCLAAITMNVSFAFAIVCTRYRDMIPVVQNLVTVAYFLTPIMWQASTLPPQHQWVAKLNPVSHVLDIARMPLLGHTPELLSWLVALGLWAVSAAVACWLFARARHRVAYWI